MVWALSTRNAGMPQLIPLHRIGDEIAVAIPRDAWSNDLTLPIRFVITPELLKWARVHQPKPEI